MFRRLPLLLPLALATILSRGPATPAIAAESSDWSAVVKSADLMVYQRPRAGTSLHEYKATGIIEAEPIVVKRVLDDVSEYPKFMPYVTEARILQADKDSRLTYQRLSPPMVSDRDYTILVRFETRKSKEGATTFCNRWQVANDRGPAEKSGVARVKITEGSWLLEPVTGGRTQATYSIFSDSGGTLPAMIANAACQSGIPRVFASVRKQVRLPKYLSAQ